MSIKKAILGTIAIMGAMGAITTGENNARTVDHTQQQANQNKSNKNDQQAPAETMGQKYVVRDVVGGMPIMGYREGIPPHIYGMRYVRRGTHKRSNFK